MCLAVLFLPLRPGSALLARAEGPAAQSDQARLDELTQDALGRIEDQLRVKIESKGFSITESPRMFMIKLSMRPLLDDFSGKLLSSLGDSEFARGYFFWMIPFVKWMSAPFIFPVETGGGQAQRAREFGKVFSLISDLKAKGLGVSLDNVGDASLSAADASAYKEYYLSLIRNFVQSQSGDELCMSLKLSALCFDLDAALKDNDQGRAKRDEIRSSLVELLQAAAPAPDKRIFVRIDMEEYAYKDLTLKLFREVVRDNPDLAKGGDGRLRLGVVIQAYLRDSARDVKELADWSRQIGVRAPIRLVKGAYLRHERALAARENRKSPIWNFKPSTDANYEGICQYLVRNRDALDPCFATHNIRSIARVMALAELYGAPKEQIEFQMLYGMGDPLKETLASMGFHLREYVPAGSFARGIKYAGRRFHELANSDNALARTMRGDFSAVDEPPAFIGEEDQKDGGYLLSLIKDAPYNP